MEEQNKNRSSAPEEQVNKEAGQQTQQSGFKKEKNTAMAIIAYIIFFVPLLTDVKNDPFVRYHVRQGLILFIFWIIVSFVQWIPPLYMITWILHLGLLVLLIIGIIHAANGEKKPLPIIGKFANKINL